MSVASQIAQRLGLAMSRLFASSDTNSSDEHYAMLDGRRASFACSELHADISPENSRNWQWSADLAHHVLITEDIVEVRSGREPQIRAFRRKTIEAQLEEFLLFLDNPRRSALPDVVAFLVDEFRGIWGTGGYHDGQSALVAFLFALHAAGENDSAILDDRSWRLAIATTTGIDTANLAAAELTGRTLERARSMRERTPLGLQLIPSLVLRHAAGRLFQEAHAILESVQLGLFDDSASIITTPTYSPAGAYFTPVPIARLMADWAIEHWTSGGDELTIADYACGSAVFLTEALRALERRDFHGKVHIIGRDKSALAITMAKVAVQTVQRDMPMMQIVSDLSQADAFDTIWPKADIVLMNPPFRSWERMDKNERQWVHTVTKGVGRPDLSVGFVERALGALNASGALVTLVPAGVLASDGLSKWREELLQKATPSLVAVLGEHGLFQHALVNVGILALESLPSSKSSLHIAWSSAENGAASRAIRALRRSLFKRSGLETPPTKADWTVSRTSLTALRQRPSWLPGPGALGSLLELIDARTGTKVEDIFKVRQGIRTGANETFIQPQRVVESLPKRERIYFRDAVDAASFVDGDIEPRNFLFVPDRKWKTESDVRDAIPQFFRVYLLPQKADLQKRKRKSSDTSRWWELTWPRFWAFDGRPRLVSKRFGLYPAFARDLAGRFAIVQANAWIPTNVLSGVGGDDALRDVLTAYWWLLNSRVIVALLREYCPNVAGGQLDLEHKYVKHVPLPNLIRQFQEDSDLQALSSSIRTRNLERLPSVSERDHFAARAFGTHVSDWNLFGLELPD